MLAVVLAAGLSFLLLAQMKGVVVLGAGSEADNEKDHAQTVPELLEKENLCSRLAARAVMLVLGVSWPEVVRWDMTTLPAVSTHPICGDDRKAVNKQQGG